MKKIFRKKYWIPLLLLCMIPAFVACDNKEEELPESHLPVFEKSAAELQKTFDEVTADADGRLEEIAALAPEVLSFDNTVKALENINDSVTLAYHRCDLIKDVHPEESVREKAYELSELYQNWFIKAQSNGEVYRILKAFSDTQPDLDAEGKKLLDETVLSFKRAGFNDEGTVDPAIVTLKNEINAIQTTISKNISDANKTESIFTLAELAGLSEEHLSSLTQNPNGDYVVQSGDRGALRDIIMTYAVNEETRKKAKTISNSRAKDNDVHMTDLIKKRVELAILLGYASWADYKTEINMAKNGQTASDFVDVVSGKLKTKLVNDELLALSKYIEAGVNDTNNQIDSWDIYYFKRLYESQELNVDYESIRKYFSYDNVLSGMFDIFEDVFGLEINPVEAPYLWHEDVSLVEIADGETQEVLGYLYLDMFPRLDQGKMGHFASYGLIDGKRLNSGKYRKPVNVLVCNFPVNADKTPQNLLFSDMGTLFHEFGHALHCILSTAKFSSQTGFHVPQDFVEVPSQILENWLQDKEVFKILTGNHPDMTEEVIRETIEKIKKADLATVALFYSRQFAFGKMDLAIHRYTDPAQVPGKDDPNNLIAVTNQIMGDTYLPFPDGSHLITSFSHLLSWGYDAGYYGYAWADSIVAELTEPFESSASGYLDKDLGMKLRKEIFESGATRDVNLSCSNFLGKELDPERKAFLRRLGVE